MNLYAYAGNNPMAFSDPFGLRPCSEIRQAIRKRIDNMRRRVRQYKDAWNKGDADQQHLGQLEGVRDGYGDEKKEYEQEKCYDDDDHDDFKKNIQVGDQLQRVALPAPQLKYNPTKRPRVPVDKSIPAPTPAQVGIVGILMIIITAIGVLVGG